MPHGTACSEEERELNASSKRLSAAHMSGSLLDKTGTQQLYRLNRTETLVQSVESKCYPNLSSDHHVTLENSKRWKMILWKKGK